MATPDKVCTEEDVVAQLADGCLLYTSRCV